jgi:kynurenine formamidase
MNVRLITVVLLGPALISCSDQPAPPTGQTSQAVALPSTRVVDLSHPFNSETVYWPTSPPFVREVTADGITPGGYYYASGIVTTSEHGGTHIDAPIHFADGAQSVDEIPLTQLMGSAVVIDVADHATANPDYLIAVSDILDWESENGPIPDESLVFFRTGFGRYWPDRTRYMGTDESGEQAVRLLHFPGLHPEAAQWLLDNRSVRAVGIDTPSIDYGQSQLFESHQALFRENIPAFENVANLDQLPVVGSAVIALPMKIEGGSGGPVRIVAFVP